MSANFTAKGMFFINFRSTSYTMGRKATNKKRYVDPHIKHKYVIKFMLHFQANGIHNLSMSAIAKELGISKTTIYNHFETKEEIIDAVIDYKLSILNEYQSVLENLTLPYVERYRKAILFFCVQAFDVSKEILTDLEFYYPSSWKKVERFQLNLLVNLKEYYQTGIDIGVFNSSANPLLLSLDDQIFFDLLLNHHNLFGEDKIPVLEAFNQHYQSKFNGIIDMNHKIQSLKNNF